MNPLLQKRIDWCITKGVRIGQNRKELEAVWDEISFRDAQVLVEIGSMAGGNLYCLAGALRGCRKVVAVDDGTWHDSDKYGKKLQGVKWTLNDTGYDAQVVLGDSHKPKTREAVELVLQGMMVDVLYIDGDHSYEGCKADVNDYAPLTREGGLVALHDIASAQQSGVRLVWGDIRRAGYWTREFVGSRKDNLPGKKGTTGVGFVRKDGEIVL